jgi:hypothetical protein
MWHALPWLIVMVWAFRPLCFLVFPPFPIPLLVLNLPRRLVAEGDALLGMIDIALYYLLLPCLRVPRVGLHRVGE